jgi:flagellar basal body rod protein FlgG
MRHASLFAALTVLMGGCVPPIPPDPVARTVRLATDLVLDWAIDGNGFFVVEDPDSGQTAYTRTGAFSIDGLGWLSTNTRPGWRLFPAVIIPPDRLALTRLSPDGAVMIPQAPDTVALAPSDIVAGPIGLCADCQPIPTGWKVLGRITIAVFERPAGLQKRPDGLWQRSGTGAEGQHRLVVPAARPASGSDSPAWDQPGRIIQGYLETTSAASLPKVPLPLPLGRSRM